MFRSPELEQTSPFEDDTKKLLKEVDEINNSPGFNTKIDIGKEYILNNTELLKNTLRFVEDTSEIYQDNFHKLIQEIETKEQRFKFSKKLVDFLMNIKMDLPEFILASPERAAEYLKKFNLQNGLNKIDDNSFMLIFKLPKQLDYFWRKSKHNLVNFDTRYPQEKKYLWTKDQHTRDMTVVEWGNMHHCLLPIIWGQRDFYCENEDIYLSRLNQMGEHRIGEFYYIWEVVKDPEIFEEDDNEDNNLDEDYDNEEYI